MQTSLEREAAGIQWSDTFFNWRLEHHAEGKLADAAKRFRKLNPDCPMSEAALCRDYAARV